MGTSYIEYVFGKAIYNIIDADSAENVLNHPNLITKGLVYNFLHPFLRTGLLTSTGELDCGFITRRYSSHTRTPFTGKKWHARRKMLTPTFHFNILNQFQEIFKILFIILRNQWLSFLERRVKSSCYNLRVKMR